MSEDFFHSHIEPHTGIIVKLCRAYSHSPAELQDLFQEVCLQLFTSRHQFQNRSKWSTWLYRVALNVCLSLARKKQAQQQVQLAQEPEATHNEAFENEEVEQLYRAIHHLKEADRALILLHLEEKSYAEIAEILGVTENNVGVRLNRIKKRLKKLMYETNY